MRISGRVISEPPMPRLARLSSSVAMTIARYSASPPSLKPPYSLGTERPKAPISARPAITSSGTSPFVRWTCSACGATTLAANDRNVSCTISMSASRWRGPADSARAARNSGSRYAARKGWAARSGAVSTPHSASRPARRVIMSWTMSAAKAHVMRASVSPFAP